MKLRWEKQKPLCVSEIAMRALLARLNSLNQRETRRGERISLLTHWTDCVLGQWLVPSPVNDCCPAQSRILKSAVLKQQQQQQQDFFNFDLMEDNFQESNAETIIYTKETV